MNEVYYGLDIAIHKYNPIKNLVTSGKLGNLAKVGAVTEAIRLLRFNFFATFISLDRSDPNSFE